MSWWRRRGPGGLGGPAGRGGRAGRMTRGGRPPGRVRRHRRATDGPRDGALPMLSREQAARFTTLARQAFAQAGLETTIEHGSLQALDGQRLGLTNIAHAAARVRERDWPRLLADHARVMALATNEPDPSSLDEVADRVYLRLVTPGELTTRPEVALELDGDLLAVPAIDYPEHVKAITARSAVDQIGGWVRVQERGLANLRSLDAEETGSLPGEDDGGSVLLSLGGFFNASRALVLDSVLTRDFRIEQPQHGVLLVAPNRHLLALHPLTGPDCLDAVRRLYAIAQGESDQPGALSGHVWFWRDGELSQISRRTEAGTVAVEASGGFGRALDELGLLGGDDDPDDPDDPDL